MYTREGVRRLVTFADAVVAIAITLLVLPLADVASQSHANVGDLLSDHVGQLGAFALSFVVIAKPSNPYVMNRWGPVSRYKTVAQVGVSPT